MSKAAQKAHHYGRNLLAAGLIVFSSATFAQTNAKIENKKPLTEGILDTAFNEKNKKEELARILGTKVTRDFSDNEKNELIRKNDVQFRHMTSSVFGTDKFADSAENKIKHAIRVLDRISCSLPPYETWGDEVKSNISHVLFNNSPFYSSDQKGRGIVRAWTVGARFVCFTDNCYDEDLIVIMRFLVHEAGHLHMSRLDSLDGRAPRDKSKITISDRITEERQAAHIEFLFFQDFERATRGQISSRMKYESEASVRYVFSYVQEERIAEAERERSDAENMRDKENSIRNFAQDISQFLFFSAIAGVFAFVYLRFKKIK